MKSRSIIILISSILFNLYICFGDQEFPTSLEDMTNKSYLIVDGEIESINFIEKKVIPYPSTGDSTVDKKYIANFNVISQIKGKSQEKIKIIFWEYDFSYEGDRVPKLNVGDKFRLFIHFPNAMIKNENGEVVEVEIYTANQVRPEAYGLTINEE